MTGDGITSWVLFAMVVPAAGILTLTTPLAVDPASPWKRLTVGVVATTAALLLLLLIWSVLLRRLAGWPRIVITFLAYLVAGATKGFLVQVLFASPIPTDWARIELLHRILINSTQWPVAIGMIVFVIGSSREYYANIKLFQAHQLAANQMINSTKDQVITDQTRLIEAVKVSLSKNINDIRQSDPDHVIADTQSFVDNTVRPLSHKLSQRVPNWSVPEIKSDKIRLSWPQFFLTTPLAGKLSPLWSTIAIAIFALGYMISTRGLRDTLIAYVILVPVIYLLLLIAINLSRKIPVVSPRKQLMINVVVLLILGIGPFILSQYFATKINSPLAVNSISYLLLGPAMFLGLSIGVACFEDQIRVNNLINQLKTDLKWIETRIRIEQWAHHGQVALALHGPYQAVIYAHLFEVQRLATQGELSEQAVTNMANRLDQTLEELLIPDVDHGSLELAIDRITTLWADVAKIECHCDQSIRDLIGDDPALNALTLHLLQDGIVNAIRHANATQITIDIEAMSTDILEVVITDNGSITPKSVQSGLGSAQLDANTLGWKLTSFPFGHRLWFTLPCGKTLEQAITAEQAGLQKLL